MTPGKQPRALFVTYGGGHVNMILPVIREMERLHPDVECLLLALTTGHTKASASRPTLGYRDFYHLIDASAARAWGEKLAPGNTSPDVPADETLAYLGINYLDLVAQHGLNGAAALYAAEGRYAFLPLHFMRCVLKELSPDVVVATNSPRSEQAALVAAKEMGIASVGMIDLFGLDSDTYVSRKSKPDWTCVISEVVRERLLLQNFSAQGIAVTGNPAFDGLFTAENREKAERILLDRGWEGLAPVLWAGHVEPYAHPATPVPAGRALPIAVEAVLRDVIRHRPELALTVRYHPSDWHTFPRQPKQDRVHFSEPPLEPIHPLILASRAVVVQTSTVGLESAVAGKPVISIESSPAAHIWFSLARMGVATPSATSADLPFVLDQVLTRASASAVNAYGSDGKAARRVAAVVINAIKSRPAPGLKREQAGEPL